MRKLNWKTILIIGATVFGALIVYAFLGQPIVDAITNAVTPTPGA